MKNPDQFKEELRDATKWYVEAYTECENSEEAEVEMTVQNIRQEIFQAVQCFVEETGMRFEAEGIFREIWDEMRVEIREVFIEREDLSGNRIFNYFEEDLVESLNTGYRAYLHENGGVEAVNVFFEEQNGSRFSWLGGGVNGK